MSSEDSTELNEYQKYELQKVAARGKNVTTLVSLVFPPAGYYLVGKTGIAALCLFTAHFGTLAHIVAPFHTRRIIKRSRNQVGGMDTSEGSPILVALGVLFLIAMIVVLPLILGVADIL